MLEYPGMQRYLTQFSFKSKLRLSKNPAAADNQQERLEMKEEEEPNPSEKTFKKKDILSVFRKHLDCYIEEEQRWGKVLDIAGNLNKDAYDMAMHEISRANHGITALRSIAGDLGLEEELFPKSSEDK